MNKILNDNNFLKNIDRTPSSNSKNIISVHKNKISDKAIDHENSIHSFKEIQKAIADNKRGTNEKDNSIQTKSFSDNKTKEQKSTDLQNDLEINNIPLINVEFGLIETQPRDQFNLDNNVIIEFNDQLSDFSSKKESIDLNPHVADFAMISQENNIQGQASFSIADESLNNINEETQKSVISNNKININNDNQELLVNQILNTKSTQFIDSKNQILVNDNIDDLQKVNRENSIIVDNQKISTSETISKITNVSPDVDNNKITLEDLPLEFTDQMQIADKDILVFNQDNLHENLSDNNTGSDSSDVVLENHDNFLADEASGEKIEINFTNLVDSSTNKAEKTQTKTNITVQAELKMHLANSPAENIVDNSVKAKFKIDHIIDKSEKHITVKMHPADLGTVNFRIEMASDGNNKLFVSAENQDTLILLKENIQELQQELKNIGVKTSGSPEFNLKDGQQNQSREQNSHNYSNFYLEDEKNPKSLTNYNYLRSDIYNLVSEYGGIDLHV